MTPIFHMLRFAFVILLTSASLFSQKLQAEEAALLVADSVLITDDDRLVAEGNVEAFYEGARLFTDKIIYDQGADNLIIPGPIWMKQSNGDILIADSADLDSKLENGILRGARVVMNRELQMLTAQTDRVEGRYTVMRKVMATSCQICGNGPPIWQIRAQRAIHDREEKQIYFKRAQFRILGVPVLYMPRLRVPDPTLKRATGFLVPRFVSNSKLGFGLKVPYFITLGDHADLTITPFVSQMTNTVQLRFRKRFRRGYVEFNGAASQDQLLPDETRSYVTGFGAFNLGNNVVLSFDIEATSDAAYRTIYGYRGRDRLGSAITLTQIKRDMFFKAELLNYETLRDNETNDTQPTLMGNLSYERRYNLPRVGGTLTARMDLHGHKRVSLADDLGRDMGRISFDLNWQKNWTLAHGFRAGLTTGLALDRNQVRQDSTFTGKQDTMTPSITASLRWPLVSRAGHDGASYLLEPIAQIGWAHGKPSTLPNDESISSEWDESNLLSLSRFPAKDRRETGVIGALGLRWQRLHKDGWSAGVSLGQVFRDRADPALTRSSGLQGLTSDTLLSIFVKTGWGGSLRARGLFDSNFDPFKAEAQFNFAHKKWSFSGNYVHLSTDAAENRTAAVREWTLSANYKITKHWTASANWQYDLIRDRAARTGGKIAYENECLAIGFGVTERYARSTTLVPVTTYELSVALNGLGGGNSSAARRSCKAK